MVSSAVDIADPPGKILVIKICCLGDVIFLTPSLRALRNRFPSARISLLTSSWVLPVVRQIPFIDDVIVFDAPLRRKLNARSIAELFKVIIRLRKMRYDAAVSAHRNRLFLWLCYLSGIPVRIGFAESLSRIVTHNVKFLHGQHEIKRYGELVKKLGAEMTDLKTEIRPDAESTEKNRSLFLAMKTKPGENLIGIFAGGGENPGTSMHIKRWGADNYRDLIERILADSRMKVILLGGPTDKELNESLRSSLKVNTSDVHDMTGRISLGDLPAFLSGLHAVIGGDTGPVHLAAAVGTKTLFIFGPSDPRLVAPIGASSVYLWKEVECGPCYTPATVMDRRNFRGQEFYCRTKTLECLGKITVDEVHEAFLKLAGSGKN